MTPSGPLAGIRVLEIGGFTNAFAGRLLADGGADVVRIVPSTGDPLATEPPFFNEGGGSIQAAWYNAGKRIERLDLAEGTGRARFDALTRGADILIEDWPAEAPAIASEGLAKLRPGLVHVSVTPFGVTGPRAHWRTNDLVANALSGSASVTGNGDTQPINGYGNQTHHTAGLYAAICALAALRTARAKGNYQRVELSEHEALVTCTEQVLMQWFFPAWNWGSAIAKRQGSLHWSRAYEVYPASDGVGVMVTAALRFADVLLPWLKEEGAAQDLADTEKFPDVGSMVRNLPYVMQVLRDWVASKPGGAMFLEGQKRHQPFGAVWNIEQALTLSPQIAERRYLQSVDLPGAGTVQFPGRLFRTSADGPHPGAQLDSGAMDWEPRAPRVPGVGTNAARPLEGLRILDFTHVLAGPFGTRVLGDLGADVLKVGTSARASLTNSPEHPYYTMWNRNKRSISLNMASAEGREIARGLAARCDVIIENFSAGVLERWGLDRDGLADVNPGVTVISMAGMGQDGPWKDFVTFAPTIHALTGLTYLTNPTGEHLFGYGFSLTDHLSGLAGALAALEGVTHRDRTGQGLAIDLSQYELGLGLMGPALLDYLANGVNPEPVGNRHPYGAWAPHGIYATKGDDEWVAIAVRGDNEWDRFAKLVGGGLAEDSRFATHALRVANQDALDAAIEAWTRTHDRFDLAERCQAAGIRAGAVQNAEDLTRRDPQLAARELFGSAQSDTWGEYAIDRFPGLFNGERPSVYEGVRPLSADTFDVMTEVLGMGDDEVAESLANGALT
ncbi:MAG: CoA transferase [Dehalococcoidia bacterium]